MEGSFSSSLGMVSTAIVEDDGIGVGAKTSFGQANFGQALFEGVGLIIMDSIRHLRCLSQNLALKFVAMSLSSFSTQTMGDNTRSTPISGSLLAVEEDEDEEEDEVDGEDRGAGDRVFAL